MQSAEDQLLVGVEYGDLGAALRSLSPELRTVVQATVIDGLTTKEAARLLGLPQGTVKTRVRAAKAQLRGRLVHRTEDCDDRPHHGTQWHAGPDLLRQYAAGRLDPVAQAAVETHVERCPDCRADAAALSPRCRLAPVWDGCWSRSARPSPAWPTRLLRRLRVPEVDVVVLRASAQPRRRSGRRRGRRSTFALARPSCRDDRQQWPGWRSRRCCRRSWSLAPTTRPTRSASWPSDAVQQAAGRPAPHPGRGPRCDAPVVLMSLVPEIEVSIVAWLLPALAIASVLLVLLTRLSCGLAVAAVATVWVLGVAALRAGDQLDQVTAPLGQSLSLLVALASALVLARRWGLLQPERSRA